MKNKLFKVLMFGLSTLFVVGCTKGGSDEEVTSKPKPSGINIVEDNKSEYRIVYETGGSACTIAAASELQLFIEKSSGVRVPITQDTGEDFNSHNKVISLGNTNIFKTSGLTITQDMRNTGYYMKRFDNTLVINAKDGNGVLNGAYDMLNYTIGLEFYADDEYFYETSETIPLLDFDIKRIPYIDMRDILMKALSTQYRHRMRLYTGDGTGQWVSFAHTTIGRYLPLSLYHGEHPDWYNGASTQVCYSNEEMRKEMIKRIQEDILAQKNGKYVMIGHEDNLDMCECDNCCKEREIYGGYGGQELHFTNCIANEIDEWLKDNCPDRDIVFVFFAYQTSSMPPVKTEIIDGVETPIKDSDGNFIPLYDFDIKENVAVFYCPIEADFSKPFNEQNNGTQYFQLKGWGDIFHKYGLYDNILIWSYSLPVRHYMVPFNNFGVVKFAYDFYKNLGACYVMDQANYDSRIPCFEALKIYTCSKMLYQGGYDYNTLADDFINHYYGLASEKIREYFYFIRSIYGSKEVSGSIWATMETKEIWTIPTIEHMLKLINEGLATLEPLKDSDPKRYEVLSDRLRKERVTPIYLMLTLYMPYLTNEQKVEYIEEFANCVAKFEIVATGEGANNVEGLVQDWKASING